MVHSQVPILLIIHGVFEVDSLIIRISVLRKMPYLLLIIGS